MILKQAIETDRLMIRNFIPEDLLDLQEIFGDDETMKNCEPAYYLEKTKTFLQDFCVSRNGAVAAVQKQTNKMIGYILFNEYTSGECEIGWIFNRQYWKQGYSYEACSSLVCHAFKNLNIHKVNAETIDGKKSVGLMKKMGMSLESIEKSQTQDLNGKFTDLYCYALSREDWMANLR